MIELERRGLPLRTLRVDPNEPWGISALSVSEFMVGWYRASTTRQRTVRETFLQDALDEVPVLPFDLIVAEVHARIWSELVSAGQRIGAHDFMIAATALAYGYAILTQNVREFSRVPGLEVRPPAW